MEIIYELMTQECGQDVVKATHPDGKVFWIPADPANSEYQRYLNPEAEQSTPSLTDEATTK
jgi:hypothetical protein